MKQTSVISLICCLLLAACTTSRKASSSTVVTKSDTVERQAEQVVTKVEYRDRERIVRDTVIKIERRTVRDTIRLKDQELPTTKDGKLRPVRQEKHENGINGWVEIQPNGDIVFECTADSLLLVVQNLVQEREYLARFHDSVLNASQTHKQSSTTTTETVIVKVKTWWGKNWKWVVVGIALLIALVLWGIKKLKA